MENIKSIYKTILCGILLMMCSTPVFGAALRDIDETSTEGQTTKEVALQEEANRLRAELASERESHERKLTEQRAEHQQEIEQIRAENKQLIETIVEQMKAEHQQEIKTILQEVLAENKQVIETIVKQQRAQHQQEIEKILQEVQAENKQEMKGQIDPDPKGKRNDKITKANAAFTTLLIAAGVGTTAYYAIKKSVIRLPGLTLSGTKVETQHDAP